MRQNLIVTEDLSTVGAISMGLAIPILAALNQQVFPLPTMVLYSQTEGFDLPQAVNLTKWWEKSAYLISQKAKVKIDGALVGYIGSVDGCSTVRTFLERTSISFVLVDPVMGDNDEFYPGLSNGYLKEVATLIKSADIITPNLFELGKLSNKKFEEFPTDGELLRSVNTLKKS